MSYTVHMYSVRAVVTEHCLLGHRPMSRAPVSSVKRCFDCSSLLFYLQLAVIIAGLPFISRLPTYSASKTMLRRLQAQMHMSSAFEHVNIVTPDRVHNISFHELGDCLFSFKPPNSK